MQKSSYSKNFERDYNFYLNNLDNFNFCGTLTPNHSAIPDNNGFSAKDVFYSIESNGINKPCKEPDLLNKLLLCKSSVNFQIKQWAETRAEGTLPLIEFSKREMAKQYPEIPINEEIKTLDWINGEPVYYRDIESQFNLPEWVIDAVERQKYKFYAKK